MLISEKILLLLLQKNKQKVHLAVRWPKNRQYLLLKQPKYLIIDKNLGCKVLEMLHNTRKFTSNFINQSL